MMQETCQRAGVLAHGVAYCWAEDVEKLKENQQGLEDLQALLFPQGYLAAARVVGPVLPCASEVTRPDLTLTFLNLENKPTVSFLPSKSWLPNKT